MEPRPPVLAAADREIVQTRVFNAPRELVFKVWTDPQHIDRWWGPRGFQNDTAEMTVAPGGVWRFMMLSAEHGDFPNRVVYLEVVPPERLVYDHGADEGEPHFRVTVTFEDQEGGKTLLTMRSVFPTAEALAEVLKFGAVEGGRQTLDRLAEYLTTL